VLEGLARHASTHAAGVLITPGPLLDYVPLYRQKDESVTTQWDMKSIEKAGLLKMDFLGLRTLSVLEAASTSICRGWRSTMRPPTACSRTPTRWRSSSSNRAACAIT
jgi:DNA polymerase III alpha subunit